MCHLSIYKKFEFSEIVKIYLEILKKELLHCFEYLIALGLPTGEIQKLRINLNKKDYNAC